MMADNHCRKRVRPPDAPPDEAECANRVMRGLFSSDDRLIFAELRERSSNTRHEVENLDPSKSQLLRQRLLTNGYRRTVHHLFLGTSDGGGGIAAPLSCADQEDFTRLYVDVFGEDDPDEAFHNARNCLSDLLYRNIIVRDAWGGVAGIGSLAKGDGVTLYYNIGVASAKRRHGNGLLVMQHLRRIAPAGVPGLLECEAEDKGLIRFYERAGFTGLAYGEVWVG
jgi:GNAT superfamily N-acetyltransferase